jgi:SAM-dependent methyltransferase
METNPKRGMAYSALRFGFRRLPQPLRLTLLSALNPAAVKNRLRRLKLKALSIGGRYRCSVCSSRVRSFAPIDPYFFETARKYGFKYTADEAEMCNVQNYTCPFCSACDRDRIYALYLRDYFKAPALNGALEFIDFAPSGALSDFIKDTISQLPQTFIYRTADLFREDVNDRVDIMDMRSYRDESVDFFICSHILEHVQDDNKALSELYRILKPGGQGILVVPIVLSLEDIDEDPSVTDVGERWRRFGQDDHVRMYSKKGFLSRTWRAGFNVRQLGREHFGKETFRTYGITDQSVLYIVEKERLRAYAGKP